MEDTPFTDVEPPQLAPPVQEAPPPRHRRRSTLQSILPWLLYIVLLVAGGAIGFVLRPILTTSSAPVVAGTTDEKVLPIIKLLLAQTRHWKGNANAPVTIIEFSDFQ